MLHFHLQNGWFEHVVTKSIIECFGHEVNLLAAGYLVSALFPGLENHVAQRYFGDLATLSEREVNITIATGLFAFVLILGMHRTFTRESFDSAILGDVEGLQKAKISPWLFKTVNLVIISYSVQFLGFLFTAACLFLPTVIALMMKIKGLQSHLLVTSVLVVIGSSAGFLLSLADSRLPTVPTIVGMLICFAALSILGLRRRERLIA